MSSILFAKRYDPYKAVNQGTPTRLKINNYLCSHLKCLGSQIVILLTSSLSIHH